VSNTKGTTAGGVRQTITTIHLAYPGYLNIVAVVGPILRFLQTVESDDDTHYINPSGREGGGKEYLKFWNLIPS
jgi:hypothetical protein